MSKNKQKKDKARNADKIFLDEREISKIGPIMEQYGEGYTVFSCSYKLTYRIDSRCLRDYLLLVKLDLQQTDLLPLL